MCDGQLAPAVQFINDITNVGGRNFEGLRFHQCVAGFYGKGLSVWSLRIKTFVLVVYTTPVPLPPAKTRQVRAIVSAPEVALLQASQADNSLYPLTSLLAMRATLKC